MQQVVLWNTVRQFKPRSCPVWGNYPHGIQGPDWTRHGRKSQSRELERSAQAESKGEQVWPDTSVLCMLARRNGF